MIHPKRLSLLLLLPLTGLFLHFFFGNENWLFAWLSLHFLLNLVSFILFTFFTQIAEKKEQNRILKKLGPLFMKNKQGFWTAEQVKQGWEKVHEYLDRLQSEVELGELVLKKIENEDFHDIPRPNPSGLELNMQLQFLVRNISVKLQERKQDLWKTQGHTQFAKIFRKSGESSIKKLAGDFIQHLARYIGASQGAIYAWKEEESEKKLEVLNTFAYAREDMDGKEVLQGLLRECVEKRKALYLNHLPDDFPLLDLGLEHSLAISLMILPLIRNDQLFGVVEIISLQEYEAFQRKFIQEVCDNYTIVLETQNMYQQTEFLLKSSQEANQKLRRREEEMHRNAQELENAQSLLKEQIESTKQERNLLKGILDAIDKTNAMVEFDLEGNILKANPMYLSVTNYAEEEIIGKPEKSLVLQEEIDSGRYNMHWQSLKEGAFLSGEYRRLNKEGKEIWLDSTYNPIFNEEGKPEKIIQLAQFTTDEKERDLEISSKLNAINQSLAIIELNQKGEVIRANSSFTNLLGYKRVELRNKTLFDLAKKGEQHKNKLKKLWKRVWEGEVESDTLSLIAKDGEEKRMRLFLSPIRKLNQSIKKVLITFIDITESESMRLILLKNQQNLSTTIAHLDKIKSKLQHQNQEFDLMLQMFHRATIAFELDEEANIIHLNDKLRKKFQLLPNETPDTLDALISPNFSKETVQIIKEGLKEQLNIRQTIKYQLPSRSTFWGDTIIVAHEDNTQDNIRYLGVVIDVTEEVVQTIYLRGEIVALKMKNAIINYQNNLKETLSNHSNLLKEAQNADMKKFEQMIRHELLPAIEIDKFGKVISANSLVKDSLGYHQNKLEGEIIERIISFKNEEEKRNFQIAINQNENFSEEIRVLNSRNGSGVYANTLVKKHPNEERKWFLYVIL